MIKRQCKIDEPNYYFQQNFIPDGCCGYCSCTTNDTASCDPFWVLLPAPECKREEKIEESRDYILESKCYCEYLRCVKDKCFFH